MPDRHGELAEVRPIYRKGDRVLVELPSGYHLLTVRAWKFVGGELWLDGRSSEFGTSFPARLIVRRLRSGEDFKLPEAV